MVKKILKILALVIVAALIVIQFFGIDKTNPPVAQGATVESAVTVPPDVTMILSRSCGDCHSNNTFYPWYADIQPAAWFLKSHIDEGRRELNFSEFNTYSTKKKKRKLEEICEQIESGNMPLPSYLWVHRDAALSDSEKKSLCDWSRQENEKIAL